MRRTALIGLVVALTSAACGQEAETGEPAGEAEGEGSALIVVTTDIWADIVDNVTCGDSQVQTLIPAGADPHSFEPSLSDRAALGDADLVVANGLGLEEGLSDVIDSAAADGTAVHYAAEHVEPILGAYGGDPHVWFDPERVATSLPSLAESLIDEAGLSRQTLEECTADYVAELVSLDDDLADVVNDLPEDDRLLITNHDSLGYLADRYGFTIIGTVIPGSSGLAQTNPAHLEDLASLIAEHDVPAIFAESQHSADDANALARTVGDVEVVTLRTGSLGESGSGAGTYVGLLRTNVETIVDALR